MAKIIRKTFGGVANAVGLGGGGGGGDARSPAQSALPAGFNAAAYYAANPDVKAAGMDAGQHYLQYGRSEGRALSKPAAPAPAPAPMSAPASVVIPAAPKYNPKSPKRYTGDQPQVVNPDASGYSPEQIANMLRAQAGGSTSGTTFAGATATGAKGQTGKKKLGE